METQPLSQITHSNKPVDIGLILGTRKYKWQLKRRYQPLWAKNGHFCSVLSPHKTNLTVYIPVKELKANIEYTICDTGKYKKIKVDRVTKHTVDFEVLEQWEKPVNNVRFKDKELQEIVGF